MLGDFNCNVGSVGYHEQILVCEGYGLNFSDVEKLPSSTNTHVNSFSLGRTWLDQCLCSQTVHIAIENVAVYYNFCGSDHTPIVVEDEIRDTADRNDGASIKWDLQDDMKVERFLYAIMCQLMATVRRPDFQHFIRNR